MSRNGKKSMAPTRVPLCKPDVGEAELQAIAGVFKSGALSHGPAVTEFETKFAGRIGARHGIAMNSCTSGLFLLSWYIRKSCGEGEIIVPSFTFVASANAIVCGGMTPRFVDVDWATGDTTADLIRPAINNRTKGIMVVH